MRRVRGQEIRVGGKPLGLFKKNYAQEAECRFFSQEAEKGSAQVVERKSSAQVEERGSFPTKLVKKQHQLFQHELKSHRSNHYPHDSSTTVHLKLERVWHLVGESADC